METAEGAGSSLNAAPPPRILAAAGHWGAAYVRPAPREFISCMRRSHASRFTSVRVASSHGGRPPLSKQLPNRSTGDPTVYIGPDSLMPVASFFAALAGFVLMFWRRLAGAVKLIAQKLFSKR